MENGRFVSAMLLLGAAAFTAAASAQGAPSTARQMIETMIAREQRATYDTARYAYLSEERSERTKGHLWTERMVETEWGTVRYLLAIDGRKLPPEEAALERSRLGEETAVPEQYRRHEMQQHEDGQRSQQMLAVLTRAFLFQVIGQNAQEIRITYRPDPAFLPQTLEERALHGLVGSVVLDARTLRLRQVDGRAPTDVSLGFGPLATLRAGSAFSTSREQMQETVWRTSRVQTAIQGRALLLKTIARQQDYTRRDFKRLPPGLSLREAVAVAEQ